MTTPAPMHRLALLILLAAALLATPARAHADEPSIRWIDAATLPVLGRAAPDAPPFQRLPQRHANNQRPPVAHLATHAAGLVVRFSTDATTIRARWTTGDTWMPHMTANAVKGLDLYALDPANAQPPRYLGTARPGPSTTHEATIAAGLAPATRELALFLPLYERLDALEIGIPDSASIAPPQHELFARPPLVIYGTSITQGACASRPGTAYTALLARDLSREVINLGFSGNGTLDPEMVPVLAEIDAAAYVLDCLPNLDPDQVEPRTLAFVRALREARPDVPILLVENLPYPGSAPDTPDRPALAAHLADKNAALRRAHDTLAAEAGHDAPILLITLDPASPATDDETADGIHPTDTGMRRHADHLAAALRPLLP